MDETETIISGPKAVLRHHQIYLAQYINIESLLPYLNQQQLLTDDENDTLLNLIISHRTRVLKLMQFMESKGETGFQRFLKAIADEPEHMGHKELSELLAPYRYPIPFKRKERLVQNDIVLQAALQPIQGAELDLHSECAIEDSSRHISSACVSMPSSSTNSCEPHSLDVEDEVKLLKDSANQDEPDESNMKLVRKYPHLSFPSGPLRGKLHSHIYNTLFSMAWGGNEEKARSIMQHMRRDKTVSLDIKVVVMEVVHTVNAERDLKVLTSALAFTDRSECENTSILKCRLHRRIAGLHYRNNDLEEADEHMSTALQLAHNIGPDIDTIYTMRLKALMLFENYKRTRNRDSYKDANRYFRIAMDHARQQPDSKRIITERIKVSKALFHLDMREECRQQSKEEDVLVELECRAQETLEDVDEEYLTDGDKAFLYMTRTKLLVCENKLPEAQEEAQKALDLNQRCGFDKRAEEAREILTKITTTSNNSQ